MLDALPSYYAQNYAGIIGSSLDGRIKLGVSGNWGITIMLDVRLHNQISAVLCSSHGTADVYMWSGQCSC